jgi:hypothetical protein
VVVTKSLHRGVVCLTVIGIAISRHFENAAESYK